MKEKIDLRNHKYLTEKNKLLKPQIEFLIVSIIILLLSILGLIIFHLMGKYLIHPSIYIAGILMGIGWLLTAIVSIKESKR